MHVHVALSAQTAKQNTCQKGPTAPKAAMARCLLSEFSWISCNSRCGGIMLWLTSCCHSMSLMLYLVLYSSSKRSITTPPWLLAGCGGTPPPPAGKWRPHIRFWRLQRIWSETKEVVMCSDSVVVCRRSAVEHDVMDRPLHSNAAAILTARHERLQHSIRAGQSSQSKLSNCAKLSPGRLGSLPSRPSRPSRPSKLKTLHLAGRSYRALLTIWLVGHVTALWAVHFYKKTC